MLALPRYVMGLADSLFTKVMGPNIATPVNVSSTNSSADEGGGESDEGSNTTAPEVIRRMEDISQDHWSMHIQPYLEPQHVTVRTSQLAGVGFPVDHKALLWCHQVVQTTTRLMTRLAATPTDTPLTGAELNTKIVKLKSSYALPTWPAAGDAEAQSCVQRADGTEGSGALPETETETCEVGGSSVIPILPVQEELQRTAAKNFFSRVALDDERKYLMDILTGSRQDNPEHRGWWGNVVGSLHVLSLALVTAHLPTVLTCYVTISLLVMATFVLYFISTKNKWSVSTITHLYVSQDLLSEMTLLLPENHLFLCSFVDFNVALLPSFLSTHFVGEAGKGTKGLSSAAVVVVLGAALFHMVHSCQNPVEFVRYNGLFVQWIVSYGAALALQLVVLLALHGIRFGVNTICALLRTTVRATVWCQPVRRFLRPRLRPFTRSVQQLYALVPAMEWIALVLLLASVIVGMVMFEQQCTRLLVDVVTADGVVPYAGRLVQVSALLFLLSYSLFLVVLMSAIVWPQAGASRLLTPMIAMCLPGTSGQSIHVYREWWLNLSLRGYNVL